METKQEYREKTKSKLAELNRKIWIVKEKADQMDEESQVEYNDLFQTLHSKFELVQHNLQELEGASENAWQDFKAKIDGALSDLNNSVGNVLSRLG